MFIIIVFWFGWFRPSGLPFSLVPARFHTLFSPSSVTLSYFILAVPMCDCLGEHWGMSSWFNIRNGTCFFPTLRLQVQNVYWEQKTWNTCALVNLSVVNLSLVNLSLVNLSVVNLSVVNLSVVNLSVVNLSVVNLSVVNLSVVNLSVVNLSVLNLSVTK